jgi:hygromycin-B 7''-O-kinase
VKAAVSSDLLDQIDHYRKLFTDAVFWQPYVQAACEKSGLACGAMRGGIAGTCPVFIVDGRYVVKFFGRLFDGEKSFQAELHANRFAQSARENPLPKLITYGQLIEDGQGWSWPYLIFEYLAGVSIGEAWEQLTFPMKEDLAAHLGQMVRILHSIPLTIDPFFPPDWNPFKRFLEEQEYTCEKRMRIGGGIPDHLLSQINTFLLPVDALIHFDTTPHLIHADLTRDHLLGSVINGKWVTAGLIDFGDAMVGNLYYELVALHLDLFQGSKPLLHTFLEIYQPEEEYLEDFAVRAMNMVLLHQFGDLILKDLFLGHPEKRQSVTWDELAEDIWGIEKHQKVASVGLSS